MCAPEDSIDIEYVFSPWCMGKYAQFERLGAAVFGISHGSIDSRQRFADNLALPLPLVVDESWQWPLSAAR